jgi:copper homeostasis protein CutC
MYRALLKVTIDTQTVGLATIPQLRVLRPREGQFHYTEKARPGIFPKKNFD